jgi:hypothetical protein
MLFAVDADARRSWRSMISYGQFAVGRLRRTMMGTPLGLKCRLPASQECAPTA